MTAYNIVMKDFVDRFCIVHSGGPVIYAPAATEEYTLSMYRFVANADRTTLGARLYCHVIYCEGVVYDSGGQ